MSKEKVEKVGEIMAEGKETLMEKRYCRVSQIKVNQESIEQLKEGKELESSYLGKVVIPGTLFKLELPILYNEENDYIYAILAGENKKGYCNLKVNTPGKEGKNETKAIKDIKTASIQVFCAYTNLPAPKRNSKGSGSCSSCKHRRKAEIQNDEGKMVRHILCGLNGMVVDKDFHRLKKYVEMTDTGLVGKKEKSTITYEHSNQSPYLNARNGRYKKKTNMKNNHTDEVCNCKYYAPWFHVAKEDKWVTGESRRLPWNESKVIGSELIVDAGKFVSRSEDEIDKLLDKLGFNRKMLKKLSNSGEDENVLEETIKLLVENEVDDEEMELLLEEIMKMRK